MKKIGNILFLYFFVFIMCMGASFAWYAWKGSEVSVDVNFANLDPYIKYSSTKVNGDTITPSKDYTGGISNDIVFNKEESGNNLDVYGHIYLKVTSAKSDNVFKASNLRWTLVSVSNNKETEISTGNFVGESVVSDNDTSKMIPANINFNLTKESDNTTYKVYVWVDENKPMNVDIGSQDISVETYAEANSIEGDSSKLSELYVRSIEYSEGVITSIGSYSSKYNINGYMIVNSNTIPSAKDSGWNSISGSKSSSEDGYLYTIKPNKAMDDINNICIRNENNEVYCKSIGKYSDSAGDKLTSSLCKSDLTYNGELQQLVSSTSGVGYTLSGYKQINANLPNEKGYKITAKLNDGYVWKDGTSDNVFFYCKIAQKDLIVKALDQTINYGETISQGLNKVTSTGLVEKDSIASITLTPSTTEVTDSGTITAVVSAILNNDGDDTMGNYNIMYEKGKLVIKALSIENATITLNPTSYTYDGNEKKPTVSVVLNNKTLVLNTDYIVSYSNNKNAGTATVTVTGKGNYTGSKSINFTINYKTYTITLDNQSATSAGTTTLYGRYADGIYLDSSYSKKMTTSANNITVPTKTGYTFGGYYTEVSGGGTQLISDSGYITSSFTNKLYNNNVTLYAKWSPNTYTVSFNSNGGTGTMSDLAMTYGTAKTLTANSFKKQYTVTYNYDGATGGNSQSSASANYKFVGWTKDGINLYSKLNLSNNSFTIDDDGMYYVSKSNTNTSNSYLNFWYNMRNDIVSGNDYTEVDVIKTLEYSGSYNFHVGDTHDTVKTQITYGVKDISNMKVGNNYFALKGSTNSSPSLLSRGFITLPANASITIKFRPVLIAAKYNNIDMYFFDSSSVKNLTATNGGKVNLYADWNETSITLPTPTKTGYTFAGWYTASSGGTKVGNGGSTYIPTSNVTLYARWNANALTFSDKTIIKTYNISAQSDTINSASNGTGTYTYSITSGNTNSYFSLSGTTLNIKKGTPVGTYTLKVLAADNNSKVTKEANVTIKINAYNLTNATIASVSNQTYTGSAIKPTPAVTVPLPSSSSPTTLTNNTDFTYSYSNNTNVGTATVTVTGKGNYTGSKSINFTIENQVLVTYENVGGTVQDDTNLVASYDGRLNNGNSYSSSTSSWLSFNSSKNATVANGTWGENYLSFNGTSSWVNLGVINSNHLTIEVTFSMDNLSSSDSRIVGNWESGGGGIYYSSNTLYAEFYINSAYHTLEVSNVLKPNQIYRATLTYDGSTEILYLDGKKIASKSVSGTIGTALNSTVMAMGTNPSGEGPGDGHYFNGKIYSLAIYKEALSAAQVAEDVGKIVKTTEKYGTLPTPKRNGYTFLGWYSSPTGGELIDSSTVVSKNENHSIYARWYRDDTTAPTISISNPKNGVWTNQNLNVVVSFSDGDSGINASSLSWSIDNKNWESISNTSTSSYTDTWSVERNNIVYYKICDNAGNCNTASTSIKIDKTSPKLTLSHNAGVITITSDTSNLYANYGPSSVTRDPNTQNVITSESTITDVSSSYPGPITDAKTWKLDKAASTNIKWIGWEDTYGGIFSGNANDIIFLSGYYKTSSSVGVSNLHMGNLYRNDWSSSYSLTYIDSNDSIIEDGNWHYFYYIFKVNESYSNAIITDAPAWGYTTASGTMYINGLNWRVIPSSNTSATDIHIRKWASGSQSLSYFQNGGGTPISGNSFKITSSGTYTVYVEDAAGNGTIQTITPSFYYLDLNGYLDGSENGGISGYGTADIYVNGSLVCNDCTDYYTQWPSGSTYEIKDIKAATGHTYNGVYSGSLSGKITGGIGVYLNFSTNSYYLDLNGNLDGGNNSGISGYGTADVYVNGSLVCNDCTDYYTQWPYGSTYEIKDIKATTGHSYNGVYSGSASGTITGNTGVSLKFTTNTYYIYFNANGGSGAPGTQSYTYSSGGTVTLSSTTPSRSGYNFLGWSTSSSAGSPSYYAGSGFPKSTASNTTLYAVWGLPTGINAYRGTTAGYYESGTKDFLYITTCDNSNTGYCNFTAKNADATSGSIVRGNLTSAVTDDAVIAKPVGTTGCNSTSCTVYVFTQSGLTDKTASPNQVVGVLNAHRISSTYPVYKTSTVSGNYRKIYFSYNTGANIITSFTLSYYAYGAGTIQKISYQGDWYFGWTLKNYVV